LWQDPDKATKISKEKAKLDGIIGVIVALDEQLDDARAMLELAQEENDASLLDEVQAELNEAENNVADLEFKRMFGGEMDGNNC
ncbi:PCRF domain-containing protein, partial [Burkholderia mallei]|uniref:PCRF domain-containing protein n=1 Tax=Burkholderia mallei TaxID=13373 RepID=UPI0011779E35